jgi:hypothetical protein
MADEQSIEDNILKSIGEGDDADNEQSTVIEGEAQEVQTESTEAAPQPTDSGPDQGSPDQQGPEQSRSPQDLVDGNGNVVAKGGKERRFYETARKERQRADNLESEISTLRAKVDAFEGTASLSSQYSLTPEELTTGAQLISAFKDNPVDTIKYLLTEAQSAGHNIEGVGQGTDVAAFSKMLDDKLGPLTTERQQTLEHQQRQEQATQTYNQFMSSYPDAAVHQNTLAQLLERDTTLSPEAAYFKLKSFYLEKGLDWNTPLDVHEQNIQAQQASSENTQSSLPSGNTPADNVTDASQIASVDTDMEDIIKDSMREAGIMN